jgi:chaperone BCS1
MLDLFIPGFSVLSDVVQRYLHVDINLYIPMLLVGSGLLFAWKYLSEYIWDQVHKHLMSSVDIRTDDELYNYIMAWVAVQRFSTDSRRFIANTNLNSRSWWVYRRSYDDEDDDEDSGKKKKPLAYTPTYGKHYFWYRGRLLAFTRDRGQEQAFLNSSEKEEIRVSCFGRNPWIIKELLDEAREMYMKRDETVTVIYRGSTKGGTSECSWQRCMARTSRPFSTVILNDRVKKELIEDVTDYLDPATRRWYSNRGIPYRRGYLLHGPPGTGKSSLSLALAGFFKMRIYIVSLNSFTANEENLSALFAELPRRCVVLLEDIDTAGLTHTREGEEAAGGDVVLETAGNTGGGKKKRGKDGSNNSPSANTAIGRLSLSALLNILDGVASQEGRVLIMTTNHLEKLDKALIRPGRVDMIVRFDKADRSMTAAIFKAIYARLEGDEASPVAPAMSAPASNKTGSFTFMTPTSRAVTEQAKKDQQAARQKQLEREKQEKEADAARVEQLAELFADRIPAHEFSPAEIQGYLLKNKRNPDAAVAGAEDWVVEARKEKQEKELREAEEKRKEEEEKEGEKAKAEKDGDHKKEDSESGEDTDSDGGEKKKKKKKAKKNTKLEKGKGKSKSKGSKSKGGDSESDECSDSTTSESESEGGKKEKKNIKRKAAKKSRSSTEEVNTAAVDEKPEPGAEGSPVESTEGTVEKGTGDVKHGSDSGYGTPTAPGFPEEVGVN